MHLIDTMAIIEDETALIQPNTITQACYLVTRNQKDILSRTLGHLNTNAIQPKGEWLEFDLMDLYKESASIARIDKYIPLMKKELHNLFHNNNTLSFELPNGKWKETVWLTDIEHDENTSIIKVKLSDTIAKIFSQIDGNYTQLFLKNTFGLRSFQSKRIYEMVMQNKPTYKAVPTLSISEFRKILELEDKYKTYGELKRSVIDKIKADINKSTDINLDYDTVKRGREITHIKFKYEFKTEEDAKSYKTDRKNRWKDREKNTEKQKKLTDLNSAKNNLIQLKQILGSQNARETKKY